jgi:hypothetical protein
VEAKVALPVVALSSQREWEQHLVQNASAKGLCPKLARKAAALMPRCPMV